MVAISIRTLMRHLVVRAKLKCPPLSKVEMSASSGMILGWRMSNSVTTSERDLRRHLQRLLLRLKTGRCASLANRSRGRPSYRGNDMAIQEYMIALIEAQRRACAIGTLGQ